jgi:peptidoglycan hydrolase FlgJ
MALRIDPNVANLVGDKPAGQVNAHDFTQFAALRRGADANDPATLREVARQFESIFTKMMLESMRSASFGDPLFGSDQADMYQDMMDDQMAVQLTSGRGIGLADMLIRQLSGQVSQPAAPPDAAAAHGTAAVDDAQRRRFIDQMLPHARAAAGELGVDVRSVIAQAALETGWGASLPGDARGGDERGSNNFFGIKAGSGWSGPSVTAATTEFAQGLAGTESARFRAYGSVAENMSDYVRLLRDNPRYAAALHTGDDVHAFATALQRGGYATDPAYADKIVAVAAQVHRLGIEPANGGQGQDVNSFKSAANAPLTPPGPSRMNSNG